VVREQSRRQGTQTAGRTPLLPRASSSVSLALLPTETRLEQTPQSRPLRSCRSGSRGSLWSSRGSRLVHAGYPVCASAKVEAKGEFGLAAKAGEAPEVEASKEGAVGRGTKGAQEGQGAQEGTPAVYRVAQAAGLRAEGAQRVGREQRREALRFRHWYQRYTRGERRCAGRIGWCARGGGAGQEKGVLVNLVVVQGGQYPGILESLFDDNLQAVLTFRYACSRKRVCLVIGVARAVCCCSWVRMALAVLFLVHCPCLHLDCLLPPLQGAHCPCLVLDCVTPSPPQGSSLPLSCS